MGEHPKTEEFTTQEYFETLIGMLNTPIGRRKNSEDVNSVSKLWQALFNRGQRSLFLQDNF